MVIRWNHIATLVVVTLTVVHCEQIISSQIVTDSVNRKFEDLCPCLPVEICPRIYGANPDDAKYLGEMEKCVDDNAVRCCGASASFVVGRNNGTKDDVRTPAPQSDVLSRIHFVNDVKENEISDAESESLKMLRVHIESSEFFSSQVSSNIANFHTKQRLNGETDDETSESKSVIKTAEFQHQYPTEDGQTQPKIIPSEVRKSYRQPKNLDDSVVVVYPNVMSGVPKTTPKNMPETNGMTMFDQDSGMDVHLVFSQTTTEPEPIEEVQSTAAVETTTKQSFSRFAKRRKQYKALQRTTTESPAEVVELEPTTVRSRTVIRQRIRNFHSRTTTQKPTDSTTKQPRVKLSTKVPATQAPEILVTSEDDKSQPSRFRLFNARHRLQYLRRSSTTATTAATTTTTGAPIEVTTRPAIQRKRLVRKRPSKDVERQRQSKVNETRSQNTIDIRPSNMNETLILAMDASHRNMLLKVHQALKEASTENKITEIPRSFAGVEMHNRVKKIEKILVEQMINVYMETMAKRNKGEVNSEKIGITNQESNTTQLYRGNKKFQMTDLLDKTPVVPSMNLNAHRRTVRVRTTTVAPKERVGDDITTTTRRPRRRRPLTATQDILSERETNIRDAMLAENEDEINIRRRVIKRRRYNVDLLSTSTTVSPPVQTTTSESITSPIISTTSTEAITTTDSPALIGPISDLNETKSDYPSEELKNDAKDESAQNVSEPVSTVDIEVSATSTPPAQKPDLLSDFKPSPLWSISSDEKNDFNDREENHLYDMNMNERALQAGHRRSRNTYDPPALHLNGFQPVIGPFHIIGPIPKSNKLGDDARIRYYLPTETKAQFSKN